MRTRFDKSFSSETRLKVAHVVSGLEVEDGGPSYSVPRLKDALIDAGMDAAVFTDFISGDVCNDSSDQVYGFVRNYSRFPLLRKFHFSPDLARCLYERSSRIDVVHSHGVWRMPNIYAARAARRHGIPHVVSPRGMLSPVALEFSRTSKKIFWYAAQKSAIEGSACVHATSLSECVELRQLGFRRPIAIIPNGIDMPILSPGRLKLANSGLGIRTLLYIGRLHPKKGINDLIQAWAAVAPDFQDWRLRIVGPGEERHLRELEALAAELPRLSIEAPVYGDAKWRAFGEADLFILPSHNENFGLTVAESLACGLPVIATKGTPWKSVETEKCGWWIDSGSASIQAALRIAFNTSGEALDQMGARGTIFIKRAFSWDRIGEEMSQVYRWLCLGDKKPDFVVLD